MRRDAPLAIDVPNRERDRPGWVKVGIIAAVGFLAGVAWPRIMGIRLGPNAPGETSTTAASSTQRAPESPPASVGATPSPTSDTPSTNPTSDEPTPPPVLEPPHLKVGKGVVLGCRSEEGERRKGRDCGSVNAIDLVVTPRIRKLVACSAARGQAGKLSVVVTTDFAHNKLSYEIGKSSNVGNTDGLSTCLKSYLAGISLSGLPHSHPRYTIAYAATLSAPTPEANETSERATEPSEEKPTSLPVRETRPHPEPKAAEPAQPTPARRGEAEVKWKVAFVRDAPNSGKVVGQLAQGARVRVGRSKDGWYAIQFGEGFSTEGWIYREAIGR